MAFIIENAVLVEEGEFSTAERRLIMALLGLDIGTTGCKAVFFDQDGRILSQSGREYGVDFPFPQWAEQDIENVWQQAIAAI